MSQSSGEKLRDDTSSQEMDEDSGHDSVDDINSAADERERIATLETAVAWIRQEVDQLKTYDKDILQELWKIRNTIHTLRETDRKPSKEESRFLDETIEDRSPTPESQVPEDLSLPSSPSPPPEYLGADGNVYGEGTLNLMATAPTHLRRSSDDLVLEEFFGSEQLTKLNIFKKQISCDNLPVQSKDASSTGDGLPFIAEEGLRPGLSMPNISHPPSSSVMSYPEKGGQVKLRLAKNNRLSDANRMSYDVCSEMEQLRARLQETAKQELAEFDRKYSPKLHHLNVMSTDAANHSRQGSLDSSIPKQQVATPPVAALQAHGHSRQHSLPIDPNFLRQLQNQQSNETTPSLATAHRSGRSPSLGSGHMADRQSPTPPLLFGHIRQVSGGSMSSEGGTFSPPLTPTDGHTPQNTPSFSTGRPPARPGANVGAALPIQHFKQSNPPGMARIASDGLYNRRAYGSSNSLSRASPEGEGNGGNHTRSSSGAQPHYSTSVVKRGGKRGSLEITPPSMPHPQYGVIGGMYKYDEKVTNGRPNAYEQPKRRSYGEDMLGNGGLGVGSGGLGRYTQVSPPRMEGNRPASPKLTRVPDRRGDNRQQQQQPSSNPISKLQTRASEPANLRKPGSRGQQEEIEPYMTSKHVKSQIPNFNYTPFSQHQQRSYTVSGGDAPKLTKKPKSTKNTWI